MVTTLVYTDLDYYVSSGAIRFINDLVTRIDGEGSLLADRQSAGGPCGNFAPKTPTFLQGVTRGVLRIAFNATTLGSVSQAFGLACMQSQRDLTAAGSAYFLHLQPNSPLIRLLKTTGGIQSGGITTLAFAVAGSVTGALQLAWDYMASSNTLTLTGWVGTQTDFSDLAQVVTYTDPAPLTTSVTEGGYYNDGGAGSDFQVYFDNMTLWGPP